MKKICIDARMINHSGIGTYTRNILSRLLKAPYTISVLATPSSIAQYDFLRSFECIPTDAAIYSLSEQIKLPFLIPSCDLFWSPHYNVPLPAIRAKKRLVTICDVYHLAYIDSLSPLKKVYAKVMIQQAVRRSDRIITISQFSVQEIVKYTTVAESKVVSIPLGVDRSHFYPRKDPKLSSCVREKYQLPQKYILFVSNLAVHKNISHLLLAWQQLCGELEDWKLVLVGKKTKDNSWEAILQKDTMLKERVLILGQIDYDDLPLLYENAYATVLPSFYEGFGLTPLEGMSCGCPAIVSNVASLPEVCGNSALYIDPYNPSDIAKGLEQMIADPGLQSRFAEAGVQQSLQFDWDLTAQRHLEVFETLL